MRVITQFTGNAFVPNTQLDEIVTLVKLVPKKAKSPILITDVGIIIELKLLQF